MTKIINGFIFIADITGYTRFLSQTELAHAQDSLTSLLDLLIKNTNIPLMISRLEGDAVISYAVEGGFLRGMTMLEMVDNLYITFKRAINLMELNTTCPCNACKNLPNLDLKFFVHFGEFGLQPLASYTELIGSDVNTIHRLTKNHVKEKTGFQAYALFTRAALQALDLMTAAKDMTALRETYDYVGEIEIFVLDMMPVWQQAQKEKRMIVSSEEAIIIREFDFPITPIQLWEYAIKPESRALLTGSDSTRLEGLNKGRIGEGSVYHCAHGNTTHPQTIVDWQPFDTFTILDAYSDLITTYVTAHLIPIETGTRLRLVSSSVLIQNRLFRTLMNFFVRLGWNAKVSNNINNLQEQIQKDSLKRGEAGMQSATIGTDQVQTAVIEGLTKSISRDDEA